MKASASAYQSLFLPTDGFSASLVDLKPMAATGPRQGVLMEMPGIARVITVEQGTHLFEASAREMIVVQVSVQPLRSENGGMNPAQHDAPRPTGFIPPPISEDRVAPELQPLRPVIRSYQSNGMTTDLRSGLAVRGFPAADDLRKFIRAQLPWPAELTE